jgi:tetratricopeptide (TPR) repeat protein
MDPYLHAIMRPQPKKEKKKSPLDMAIDNQIDSFLDTHNLEEDNHSGLQSHEQKKQKMKVEIEESLKLPELAKQVETAVKILTSEGAKYLSKEANQLLLSELNTASELIPNVNAEIISEMSLQAFAKISDDSMQAIAEIGNAKFSEGSYSDSLALFSLLSLLNPGYSEFWVRLGIAAYHCGNYDLALCAYLAAEGLDPHSMNIRLFVAECYLMLSQMDKAREELAAAKAIKDSSPQEQVWLDLLKEIEGKIEVKP